jgi:hypothetical protein
LFTNVLPCFSSQAELYTGGGAEYYVSCDYKDSSHLSSLHTEFLSQFFFNHHSFCVVPLQNKRALLETKIARAQTKKRGMWSLGSERISAADHKRGVTSKKAPVPVAAAATSSSRSSGSVGRGGAQAETGRSSSKATQGRGSNALESVMTGLEFVG